MADSPERSGERGGPWRPGLWTKGNFAQPSSELENMVNWRCNKFGEMVADPEPKRADTDGEIVGEEAFIDFPEDDPDNDDDDLIDRARDARVLSADDFWQDIARLEWPFVSDRVLTRADVDAKLAQMGHGRLAQLRVMMRAQADALVSIGAVEDQKDGIAVVVCGQHSYAAVKADPSFAIYVLGERQAPDLLARISG